MISSSLLLDKSKGNKRRDGTPEKPVTPNQSQSQMEEEVIPPSKLKIDGEDVQALAINVEEMAKVNKSHAPFWLSFLARHHII